MARVEWENEEMKCVSVTKEERKSAMGMSLRVTRFAFCIFIFQSRHFTFTRQERRTRQRQTEEVGDEDGDEDGKG